MVFCLGDTIKEWEEGKETESGGSRLYLVTYEELREILETVGICHEGELDKRGVEFSKIETQQDYILGSIAVPKLLDVLGKRYRLLFFINKNNIIIADDDEFAYRILTNIRKERTHQGGSIAQFIYHFMLYIVKRDNILLEQYENMLMEMEEDIINNKTADFQNKLMPLRKELLTLRSYYEQLADMGEELEDNENGFFEGKQLKYFGVISDRANRYKDKANYLLEYANQVRDAYQAKVDARQNGNMQFLTIISTIFFPLTLITGWYGMNFQNMPELAHGYPYVIGISVLVVVVCIIIFKKKKLL